MSLSPTNQPTNNSVTDAMDESSTAPDSYLSVRLTIPATEWSLVESKLLYDVPIYIGYPHVGGLGENAHFHILIPSYDKIELLRQRIKRGFKQFGEGNALYAIKSNTNGLLHGIQYCGHENTVPYVKGEFCDQWVNDAPKWEQKMTQTKIGEKRKAVHEDHYREITYRNMLKVCFRHRSDRRLTTGSLAKVLESLHKENWFLNVQVLRAGIPSTYYDQFEAMCREETVMTEGRFNRMRVVASWEGGADRSF